MPDFMLFALLYAVGLVAGLIVAAYRRFTYPASSWRAMIIRRALRQGAYWPLIVPYALAYVLLWLIVAVGLLFRRRR